MKLKSIFIIFNVLVVISFLFVFFLPAFFLGWDYTAVFWGDNWYLAVLFLAVLAILNVYFGRNWRLFTALEHEDWDAVISVMERRVFGRGPVRQGNVRLLINAYVVTNRTGKVGELELHLREHAPKVLQRSALLFGIPHLLSNNGEEMAAYYGEFLETGSRRDREWIRWNYAFALMLQQRLDEAREILLELARETKPGLLQALSAYLLDAYQDGATKEIVGQSRSAIQSALSRREWQKRVDDERSELHILVLSKLLRDVEEWLYGDAAERGNTAGE